MHFNDEWGDLQISPLHLDHHTVTHHSVSAYLIRRYQGDWMQLISLRLQYMSNGLTVKNQRIWYRHHFPHNENKYGSGNISLFAVQSHYVTWSTKTFQCFAGIDRPFTFLLPEHAKGVAHTHCCRCSLWGTEWEFIIFLFSLKCNCENSEPLRVAFSLLGEKRGSARRQKKLPRHKEASSS